MRDKIVYVVAGIFIVLGLIFLAQNGFQMYKTFVLMSKVEKLYEGAPENTLNQDLTFLNQARVAAQKPAAPVVEEKK